MLVSVCICHIPKIPFIFNCLFVFIHEKIIYRENEGKLAAAKHIKHENASIPLRKTCRHDAESTVLR